MNDEHIEARIDVRKDFADKHNTKAALGKHEPGVDKSLEQETREILEKVAMHKWTVAAGVSAIVNLYADKGPVLLPFGKPVLFNEMRGPRIK